MINYDSRTRPKWLDFVPGVLHTMRWYAGPGGPGEMNAKLVHKVGVSYMLAFRVYIFLLFFHQT